MIKKWALRGLVPIMVLWVMALIWIERVNRFYALPLDPWR